MSAAEMHAHDNDRVATARAEQRSTPQLAKQVIDDVTTLLKNEGELARVEMKRNMKQAAAGIASMIGAAAVLIAGLTCLLIALGVGIADLMDVSPWIGYAIAGAIGLVIGAIMIGSGKKALEAESLLPTRTAENLKKDVNTAKESLS